MKFTNIILADGVSGARSGQGLKRGAEHYVTGSHYGFSTLTSTSTVDTDYYVIWNLWPTFTGTAANTTITISGLTALTNIGITNLYARSKPDWSAGSLDCAIVRKLDRRAARITITGEREADYRTDWTASNATVAEINPSDGPWSPEIGRLVNMGYIG